MEIRRHPDRYELEVDGDVIGHLEIVIDGSTLTATSTVVDPAHGGQGYAGMLVKRMLDDAREEGLSVIPACSYVAAYIAKHEEYSDLLASSD
ncbi:GNAT family N-acetyltransferase [Flaviflexus equikiangi]|uniref:GNAT family N-acetyltransferase n=1 Tax=Flaviflexus equikiangi TaxID=2758573 RepID=UPI0015F5E629|nr:GNAT family N-acetyltransferase [Flaviflexus equikiangi]